MSRTKTVENIWDLDEEWFSTFTEPSFGQHEPITVGDLSFDPLKDYYVDNGNLPIEFDTVETLNDPMQDISLVPPLSTGFLLGGTASSMIPKFSPNTTTIPELSYGPQSPLIPETVPPLIQSNPTPSKDEIAQLRYNFYSSPHYLASVRHDLLPPPLIDPHVCPTPKKEIPSCGYNLPIPDDLPSPEIMNSVLDFKEALGTLDPDQLNEYISQVGRFRNLSSEEKEELKHIIRRVKNREAARRLRREKKGHVTELEKEVKLLKNQVQSMKMELASIRTENTYLKNEIQFSATIINTNPMLAQLYNKTRGHPSTSTLYTTNNPGHFDV